ncbi:hypothetical protein [Candidatus Coxiella mudrowiae]|uniref:hypothetical protein n=1 Tax=Candidatus Coxiella mudrowiae TaxID=2054173 RepID=UPI00069E2C50|nr:hypothetical protein [Candidatus Coxiella mudrowiae]
MQCEFMEEMGFNAILLNLAVALSNDPISMAWAFAFAHAIKADRLGYEASMIEKRNIAKDTTLLIDKPFFRTFQNEKSYCLGNRRF